MRGPLLPHRRQRTRQPWLWALLLPGLLALLALDTRGADRPAPERQTPAQAELLQATSAVAGAATLPAEVVLPIRTAYEGPPRHPLSPLAPPVVQHPPGYAIGPAPPAPRLGGPAQPLYLVYGAYLL